MFRRVFMACQNCPCCDEQKPGFSDVLPVAKSMANPRASSAPAKPIRTHIQFNEFDPPVIQHINDGDLTNDEPTNGLRILRKKIQVTNLSDDLGVVSQPTVLQRLKLLLEKLESGTGTPIPYEIIRKNLKYAVDLIQDGSLGTDRVEDMSRRPVRDEPMIPIQEIRREESDHELSEVDEEVIPDEVKAWLASTFTKNEPPRNKSLEPRPRFRSVANAIRVGLFVDRFYRQLSSNTLQIPPEVQSCMKEISNWHFDIFKLHDKSHNHSLKYVVKDLFSRYGLLQKFKINLVKLDNFIGAVEVGYTKLRNPYHNDIHAADVTQSLHYFIGSSGVSNILTDLEIFAILFAAVIHDFEHTGRTNNFHVNVGTDLALMYNDRAVLENHHVSAAFRLLKDDDRNILCNMKPDDFREFRTLVIEMVLNTDMSTHFTQLKNVRSMLKEGRSGGVSSSKNTVAAMSLILHCADISHPGKPWKIHKRLADHILEEFFMQGDEEAKLGLPFSPLCDRSSVLVPESQISFIEFIVEPSMTVLGDLIDFMISDEGEVTVASLKESTPVSKLLRRTVGRRAESDQTIPTSSSGKGKVESRMLNDGGRTSSFPCQAGNHNPPNLRPWINHLQENKAKWKMIATDREKTQLSSTPTPPTDSDSSDSEHGKNALDQSPPETLQVLTINDK